MKRLLIGLLLIISMMFSLVMAADAPNLSLGGADVEKIGELQDEFSPLNDEGDIDLNKYKPFKSKAEERIDNINLWLKNNASWLSAIFGMVPEISWLFAINLYLILLFLVVLVFNGDAILDIFDVLGAKVDLGLFETHWSNIFGLGIFATLLVTKTLILLAEFLEELFLIFWNYILPAGLAIAIILIIVIVVLGGFVLIKFLPQILQIVRQGIKKRKEKKKAKKVEANEEVLEKIVNSAIGK